MYSESFIYLPYQNNPINPLNRQTAVLLQVCPYATKQQTMNTTISTPVKVAKAAKVTKVVKAAKVNKTEKEINNFTVNVNTINVENLSKGLAKKVSKVQTFKTDKTKEYNSFERLGIVSANLDIQLRGLNAAVKFYLQAANGILTPKQTELLTFGAIRKFINDSDKHKDKQLFSANDIKLICSAILKANDNNTARALKAAKQAKKTANK